MQAVIIGLGQQLSLVDGSSSHQLTIQLPSGAAFIALVDEEVAQLITEEFVAAGSEAAAKAVQAARSAPPARPVVHHALESMQAQDRAEGQHSPAQAAVPAQQDRSYAPMELAGELSSTEDGDLVFGGSSSSSTLDAVGAQLQRAEKSLATAIGDVDVDDPQAMRDAANRLRGIGDLPTPRWVASSTGAGEPVADVPAGMPKLARRALRVDRDEAGNPILRGPGVANHRALLGGTNVEEGDAGQL